ncbi:MAG: pyruvate ferredoxin oxidoreductase [Desulfobacteraceae bacterium]|jgi:pyruvate ferredoxin oxidoreductase alpha subunit|nr:pyruvate ferredoxin oxidoreductase [Desulfobacteraceae bacterium]
MSNVQVLEGSEAVALAVKACRPQVISAFPISPQTHIVEGLARLLADGDLNAEYVRVDSEFSAASVISGASAAGSRAYTASSSQGLLLMSEVLYASCGLRLPFVITGVNRTVSAPISIQVDQQDTMSLRDCGMIQLFVESSQEAYDTHIAAFKIAEDPKILLPVMVCMDGWVLTHSYERITLSEQEEVDRFLPAFQPLDFLDVKNPKTWGSIGEEDMLMELRYSVQQAMQYAKGRIQEIFAEWAEISGRDYGGLIESYRTEDAEVILLAMGSMAGTIKETVDNLRSAGEKVGHVRIRSYRPFPYEEIWQAVKGAKAVAVLDANLSFGSEGAIGMDLKAKLYGIPGAPQVISVIAGLGGRDVDEARIKDIVNRVKEVRESGYFLREPYWAGLNPTMVP